MKLQKKISTALILVSSLFANPISTYDWLRPDEFQFKTDGTWQIEVINGIRTDSIYSAFLPQERFNNMNAEEKSLIEYTLLDFSDIREMPIMVIDKEKMQVTELSDTMTLILHTNGKSSVDFRTYSIPTAHSDSSSFIYYEQNFYECPTPTPGELNPEVKYYITGRTLNKQSVPITPVIIGNEFITFDDMSMKLYDYSVYDTTDENGYFTLSFPIESNKKISFYDTLCNAKIANFTNSSPYTIQLPDTIKPLYTHEMGELLLETEEVAVTSHQSAQKGNVSGVKVQSIVQKTLFLNILNMNSGTARASLFALNGSRLFSKEILLSSGMVSLDLKNIASGSYILRVEGSGINHTVPVTLK